MHQPHQMVRTGGAHFCVLEHCSSKKQLPKRHSQIIVGTRKAVRAFCFKSPLERFALIHRSSIPEIRSHKWRLEAAIAATRRHLLGRPSVGTAQTNPSPPNPKVDRNSKAVRAFCFKSPLERFALIHR